MAEITTPSAGRGVRRAQAPSRLTYKVLGNPSDFIGQNYRDPAGGGPHGNQVGGPHRNQVGGPLGNQVGVPHESQVGGTHEGQAGDPEDSHASEAYGSSSTSVRLKQNKIEAEKKIGELQEQISAKRRELAKEESELNRATSKLNLFKNNPSSSGCVQELELKIVNLQENGNVLKSNLKEMEQLTRRKVTIIEEEEDLMDKIIIEEESNTKSAVLSDEVRKNTENWIADQNERQHYEDFCSS